MDLFNGVGRPMMRLVEKGLFSWFVDLFPYGGGWRLLAFAIFLIVAVSILSGLAIASLLWHSREQHTRIVTIPFAWPCGIAGVVFGIMSLIDPDGVWNVLWHLVYIIGLACFAFVMHAFIEKMEAAPRSKAYYWCIGISFAIQMFLVGLYAATLFFMAIAFMIIIIVVLFVAAAGLKIMTTPPPPSANGGRRRATLENGTQLEEIGATWYAGNGDTYHQNMDGTFTKN